MGKPKLLLIESNPQLCLELETLLRKDQWIVTSSTDPIIGFDHIRKENFDVMVLDVRVMTNFVSRVLMLIAERKAAGHYHHKPQLVLTSTVSEVPEYKACQLSNAPLCLKPFSGAELIALLKSSVKIAS